MTRKLSVLLLLLAAAAAAQQPAVIVFHFQRSGLPVPEYTFTVNEDGNATYDATYAAPTPDVRNGYGSATAQNASPIPIKRPITLSAQTTAHLFERIRSTGPLRIACESKAKGIADTGTKTLTYTGSDGTANCTYNFTENKSIYAITETFQGIAETLDEGRSIDLKHRYDRLGLDHELSNLVDAVHDGRAIEVATIAPVLQSLCDDAQVMERVRKRAAGLLSASVSTR